MKDYFFISSPLHFFIAAGIALQNPRHTRTAVLMTKDAAAGGCFAAAAERFPQIFDRVIDLSGRQARSLRARGPRFARLRSEFQQPMQARIFTGNDRRIEFQFAMHVAAMSSPSVEGIYMDEGAITYVGHKSMHSLQHRYLDPLFKKLFYGAWYKNALTTGASAWVATAYVAFPDLVHPLLQSKQLVAIDTAPFTSAPFRALAAAVLGGDGRAAESLRGVKLVLTMPHEGSYIHNPTPYRDLAAVLGDSFAPAEVAIKAHPRITDHDLLPRLFAGMTLLDNRCGMEMLLPLLNDDCIIAGDISSTLLTARWLRPSLPVIALKVQDSAPGALLRLYDALQIPMIEPGKLAEWLADNTTD